MNIYCIMVLNTYIYYGLLRSVLLSQDSKKMAKKSRPVSYAALGSKDRRKADLCRFFFNPCVTPLLKEELVIA